MDGERDPAPDESPEERRLLAELRRVAGLLDPVPDGLIEVVRAGLGWRRLDAELAELIADELVGGEAMAVVPGESPSRLLRFAAGDLMIDLEVFAAGRARRLLGRLEPPGPATVTLRHAGGSVSGEADEDGGFSLPPVPAGPVSLRVELAAGHGRRAFETSWLSV